ncbi:hypothetical protein Patl1_01913 [Pistacia atlantica]|uniref:Uncharacterized protein n=1 Tax=Pistacia atlantica TaxID=434234 RepID=A0ACC1CDM8_9ROSI|nr:hypothetical protein Patl1_01913 [Pistacia atlantica]
MDPTYGGNLWVTSPGTVGFHTAGFAALRQELEKELHHVLRLESTQTDGNGNGYVDSEVAPPLAAVESTETDGNGNGNVDSEVAPPLAAVESTETDGNGNVDSEVAPPLAAVKSIQTDSLAVVETIQTDNSGNENVDSEFYLCNFINWQTVRRYASFLELLESEHLAKVLPGVKTMAGSVRALEFGKTTSFSSSSMSESFSRTGSGLALTPGTTSYALPLGLQSSRAELSIDNLELSSVGIVKARARAQAI